MIGEVQGASEGDDSVLYAENIPRKPSSRTAGTPRASPRKSPADHVDSGVRLTTIELTDADELAAALDAQEK